MILPQFDGAHSLGLPELVNFHTNVNQMAAGLRLPIGAVMAPFPSSWSYSTSVAAEGWKVGGAECSCIAGTRTVREACSPSRGVWGHVPPGKF